MVGGLLRFKIRLILLPCIVMYPKLMTIFFDFILILILFHKVDFRAIGFSH